MLGIKGPFYYDTTTCLYRIFAKMFAIIAMPIQCAMCAALNVFASLAQNARFYEGN